MAKVQFQDKSVEKTLLTAVVAALQASGVAPVKKTNDSGKTFATYNQQVRVNLPWKGTVAGVECNSVTMQINAQFRPEVPGLSKEQRTEMATLAGLRDKGVITSDQFDKAVATFAGEPAEADADELDALA